MAVYFVLIGFVAILYLLHGRYIVRRKDYLTIHGRHKKTRSDVMAVSLFCAFLIALRAETVGLDTWGYNASFQRQEADFSVLQGPFLLENEIGWDILQIIIKKLGLGFGALLWIEAVVYIAPLSYIIYKYSKNPYMSLFLFIAFDYFLFAMSAIRQTYALGFVMMAFVAAQNKHPVKFSVLVALASLFHMTAIVAIPIYFLSRLSLKNIYIFLAIVLGAVLVAFKGPIQEIMREVARIGYEESETGGNGMYLFMLSIVMLDIYTDHGVKQEQKSVGVIKYMIIAAIVMYPLLQFNPSIFRLHFYYSIFIIIYIPNVLKKIRNPYFRLAISGGYLTVATYYFMNYPLSGLGVVPYVLR